MSVIAATGSIAFLDADERLGWRSADQLRGCLISLTTVPDLDRIRGPSEVGRFQETREPWVDVFFELFTLRHR